MKKKLIAIVASLAMVATMVPASAFAAEANLTATMSAAESNDHAGTEGTAYKALLTSGYEDNITIVPTANGLKLSGALPYTEFKEFAPNVKSMQTGHYLGFKMTIGGTKNANALIRTNRSHKTDAGVILNTTDDVKVGTTLTNRVRLDEGKTFTVDWRDGFSGEKWYTSSIGSIAEGDSHASDYADIKDMPALSGDAIELTFDTTNLTMLTEAETDTLDAWVEKVDAIPATPSNRTDERKVTYAREAYDALSAELKAVINNVDNYNKPHNYKNLYGKMIDAEKAVANNSTIDAISDKIARLKALPKTEFKDQAEIEGYFAPLDEVNKLVAALDTKLANALVTSGDKAILDTYNNDYNALIKKYVDPKYAAAEKIDLTKETLEDSELALIRELKAYVDGGYIKTANIANFKQATYDALVAALEKIEKDAKSLANAEVTVAGADSIVYDGTKKTPDVTVTIGGKEVAADAYDKIYSDNKDAGEATITIIPKDESGYTGKKEATFTIKPAALTTDMVKVANATYTGKALKPAVSVASGVDYTVAYKNNTAVGKASAVVTGTGNYTGTITKNFIVKPAKESITSLKAGKKQITVAYKAQTGAKYRVICKASGLKAIGTNTTATKKTVKKLKSGKTYQVKVRAYKAVDGKTYYGTYSAVKKVKVK